MTDIHAVLLVPEVGDPLGLLREGPCGARPPVVALWRCRDEECAHAVWLPAGLHNHPHERCERWPYGRAPLWVPSGSPRALVLAWGGKVVWQGYEVLVQTGVDRGLLHMFLAGVLAGLPAPGGNLWPGTLVLLDAEGREVTDAE